MISQTEEISSPILYFKGIILMKEGFKKEAVLCFEQCLKLATDKDKMCASLIEITKTKIDERDFYSAYYHINRS